MKKKVLKERESLKRTNRYLKKKKMHHKHHPTTNQAAYTGPLKHFPVLDAFCQEICLNSNNP